MRRNMETITRALPLQPSTRFCQYTVYVWNVCYESLLCASQAHKFIREMK